MQIPLTKQSSKEWKEECLRALAKFDAENQNPMTMNFWSASAQFNCFENWWKMRLEYIRKYTEEYFASKGYRIDWEKTGKNPGLALIPINQ